MSHRDVKPAIEPGDSITLRSGADRIALRSPIWVEGEGYPGRWRVLTRGADAGGRVFDQYVDVTEIEAEG